MGKAKRSFFRQVKMRTILIRFLLIPATALAPHVLGDLNALRVCSGMFGATVGVYVSLTSVILVDLLGLDKLTNAFGLLLLFQGVATVIGPPIVGT